MIVEETVIDVDPITALDTGVAVSHTVDAVVTDPIVPPVSAPITPPVTPTPPVTLGIDPLDVRVEQRFGYRNVRGKPTKVPTQHLDIFVDGRMHAWTFKAAGADIFAIAEFLEHEIPQLQDAVKSFTGEDELRSFRANNTPTQAEVEKLQRI